MIHAREMRKRAETSRALWLQIERQAVLERIKRAAEGGKTSLMFTSLDGDLVEELLDNGFRVVAHFESYTVYW